MKLNKKEDILVVFIGFRYVKNQMCRVQKIKAFNKKGDDINKDSED